MIYVARLNQKSEFHFQKAFHDLQRAFEHSQAATLLSCNVNLVEQNGENFLANALYPLFKNEFINIELCSLIMKSFQDIWIIFLNSSESISTTGPDSEMHLCQGSHRELT